VDNKSQSHQTISANITGDISGQVAVGQNINQAKTETQPTVALQELEELRGLLAQLRNKVELEASADKKVAALEHVNELEQAVTEQKPDLSTMKYVRNWFVKNVPSVAGAVVSVVVHPIVGRLVAAAGDALTADFQKRFGVQ
jgi:3-methyladenine DNA glycosylase/8-oxoguanine DNA glycosylase